MSIINLTPGIDVNLDILVPTERKKAMMSELERLDAEWKQKTAIDVPEVVTYERKSEKPIDVSTIRGEVEASRAPNASNKIATMEGKAESSQAKMEGLIEDSKEDLKEAEGDILSNYENASKSTRNSMIDRGLARSSISKQAEKQLADMRDGAIQEARDGTKKKISSLEMEIEVLKSQLATDIENFRISEAIKVQEEIDKAVEKLTAENEKIKEYNDKLTQKEEESARKRAEALQKAEEARIKEAEQDALYGYQGDKRDNYYERLDAAKKYYGSIPKEQALKELQSDVDVKNYLGLFYNKLLSYVYAR